MLRAQKSDDDLAPFPKVLTYNGDDTVNTITVTAVDGAGNSVQYRKTFGYSGGLMVTESAWVQL